jgi:uncharacterized protein YaaQ
MKNYKIVSDGLTSKVGSILMNYLYSTMKLFLLGGFLGSGKTTAYQ